jgi:hypothetical protein
MKSINLCSLIILVFIIPANSQNNADYFPYEKNNYWEYLWLESLYPDTIVSLSVFDSVDNQSRKIAVFDSYFINPIKPPAILPDSGTYIIDSSLNVYSNFTLTGGGCVEEYLLVYKLNGNRGDQWVLCDVGGGGFHLEMARIKEIRNDVILGINTTTMWIDYYLAEDSSDTTGLGRGGDVLGKGFGLIARQSEGWPGILIKGAVINGVLYGDTTTVGVNELLDQYSPKDFQLYQNYPNPFNPITKIKYDIIKAQDVIVSVYDILGREIAILVNEQQRPGSYEVKWEASNFSSGIYFYRLNTTDYVDTKKLILLK